MRFRAVVTSAIVLGTLGAGGAWAEIDVNGPAEVPPASYTGRQYVDSAGCVFVRAGFGTAVNWVPRIDRGRKQLCGYKPTLAEGAPVLQIAKSAPEVAAPAPTPTPAVAPERTAPVAAPAPAPRVAPKPAAPVRTVSTATPAPASPFARTPFAGAPMPTIALTTTPPRIGRAAEAAAPMVAAAPAPRVTVATAPVTAAPGRGGYVSPYTYAGGRLAPLPLPGEAPASIAPTAVAPVVMAGAAPSILRSETIAAPAACPNGASVAQRYYLSDGRRVLRCSAETADPVGFINGAGLPGLQVAGFGPRAPEAVAYAAPSSAAPVYSAPVYAAPSRGPVLVGGTGYNVTQASNGPVPAMTGVMTPQQAYARHSPYQAQGYAPQAVQLRSPAGQTLLAPVGVSSKDYDSGFKPAFEDGRLNPYRGPRAAMGDATMGQIWTNQVPAQLVTPRTPARLRIKSPQPVAAQYEAAPVETVLYTTKSAPAAVAAPRAALAQPKAQPAAGARYVQVGSFGVPANAEAAKARLRAAGLPVSSGASGKLTVVYAGPVPGAEAARALAAVRAAGFGDAYLR